MRTKLTQVMLVLLIIGLAFAENLVIYPFDSQDVLLGVAVADKVAVAFDETFEVIAPDVAPTLVPPFIVQDGFISPIALINQGNGLFISSAGGARLLQGVLGADNVVTGYIDFVEDSLSLTGYIAYDGRVQTFTINAPQDDPGVLASKLINVLALTLNTPAAETDTSIDLSSNYGDYVRALTLIGGGFINDALNVLEAADSSPEVDALLAEVRAVLLGEMGERAGLLATMSLSVNNLNEAESQAYFEAFAARTSLPVANVWLATLEASQGNTQAAQDRFASLDAGYEFGQAAAAVYAASEMQDASALSTFLDSSQLSSVLAVDVGAQILEDVALRKQALKALGRLAPSWTYSFQELSFIAFDEDDPLAAAEALVVAVELQPESDLYWTNLGWAYYLLGFLDRSEAASLTATQLDANQYIGFYNLGLARAVTGRLDEAMDAYRQALAADPDVDDEAVKDLENALELYPGVSAVHFALGSLYEAEGRRAEAADQFEAYLMMDAVAPFDSVAAERVELLRAPPPPIEISEGVKLGLGLDAVTASPYHPGDRVYPTFELFTPGFELPSEVMVDVSLLDADGQALSSYSEQIRIPQNAIGYQVSSVGVDIPLDVTAGTYTLKVTATASEAREASVVLDVNVEGDAMLFRQLVSRNIVMQSFDTGTALYSAADLGAQEETLLGVLVRELRQTSELAEDALPTVATGRFEGLSGGELFSDSSVNDVRDFLNYLIAQDTHDTTFTFVDAYAQWALDGAQTLND